MRSRQFSLAHLTALHCSPPELIRIAANAGYDFVGLRTMALGLPGEPRYDLCADRRLYQETKAALAATGVRLLDIELVRIVDDQDPRSFLPALEAGASLGARHVLTSIWTPNRRAAIETLGELCDVARPLGLTVNLEFVAWASCASLPAALEVLSETDRENAGIMIDTFHFHHARHQVEELDAVPPAWFHFAHVCDDRKATDDVDAAKRRGREERLLPGEGVVDIAGILGRLPAEVVYAIELPNHQRLERLGAEAFARTCLSETMCYLSASERGYSEVLPGKFD